MTVTLQTGRLTLPSGSVNTTLRDATLAAQALDRDDWDELVAAIAICVNAWLHSIVKLRSGPGPESCAATAGGGACPGLAAASQRRRMCRLGVVGATMLPRRLPGAYLRVSASKGRKSLVAGGGECRSRPRARFAMMPCRCWRLVCRAYHSGGSKGQRRR